MRTQTLLASFILAFAPAPQARESSLHTCWPQGLLKGHPSRLPGFAASECVGGLGGGRVHGLRLVLLFAMRDDVTQVPVVQIATHIWRESSKHLLDLGKGPGVSLDQGRVGDRARGHPRASGRVSLPY